MTERCYKLLPKATYDLEGIWLYGVKRWGLAQAEKYLMELEENFQIIAVNPYLCREREEYSPPVRIHHHGRHLIIYTIQGKDILIVRVLHDSMLVHLHL